MKTAKLSFLVMMASLLWGCNQEAMQELETKNLELSSQLENMDSTMNAYLQTIGEVEENLTTIKVKQNLISSSASDDVEFSKDMRESLVNDLQSINDLMTSNREKISSLQESLKNSNFQVAEFKKLLARVNQKLEARDKEIKSLNTQVEDLVSRNHVLDENLTFLTIKVDTLSATNELQRLTISNQKKLIAKNLEELSSGFVATGTLKELEEKDIVRKEGGILGLGAVTKLNNEFSKDDFLKIDINKTQTIPLMVKRVRVITNHPADSYKIEHSKNGDLLANLVITNPERFWNASKYLVVRVN